VNGAHDPSSTEKKRIEWSEKTASVTYRIVVRTIAWMDAALFPTNFWPSVTPHSYVPERFTIVDALHWLRFF
jgi:hypothetical protein